MSAKLLSLDWENRKRRAQQEDELPIEFLRRMVAAFSFEHESLLDALPRVSAVLEYFDLWAIYDTDLLGGIAEVIEEGEDPEPYNSFVRRHKLNWRVYDAQAKEWVDPPQVKEGDDE